LFFIIINLAFLRLSTKTPLNYITFYVLQLPIGIFLTHGLRYFIIKYNIIKLNILYQILFVVLSSGVLSLLFFFTNVASGLIFNVPLNDIISVASLVVIINNSIPFIFWSLIYFGFHYLQNYKQTEIRNLRWEAASKDIELNKLKSQLNPHFMFNSMNSIRALIDEDPAKAKEAVTQLSNILRNTLLMNKSKEILLEEELKIVKDYLDLEHIRYEERLQYDFSIDDASLKVNVPPLIVQTQVENAIKHGISKLSKGGRVTVNSKIKDRILEIEIINTGQIVNAKSDTGFGFANSKHRLELLYGEKATIEIINKGIEEVSVKINIPLTP
jgi:two-component system LytT family sensor kinase